MSAIDRGRLAGDEVTDIAIVGGGVAGLGSAIALAKHGMRITVIERRAQVGGIHRGDSLLPKTTALLFRWGLRAALEEAGARPIHRLEIHAPGDRHVFEMAMTAEDAVHPYLVLPHARFEAVLMQRAMSLPNVRIVRPASFVDLIHETGSARTCGVRYRRDGEVHALHCGLVLAADGQHSAVRKRLGIDCETSSYDHAYLGLEADRPAGYRDAMRVHFHARGGALLMPHPERIGVGLLVDAGMARHWLTMPEAELAAELARRAPILQGMALHMDGAHVYELTRAHAAAYARPGAVIIGDAAHCTNPTAGQGMAMALDDAGILADILGPRWTARPADIDAAIDRYQALQRPVNARLVRNSDVLAKLYALRGPAWTALKLLGVTALSKPAMRGVTLPLVSKFLQVPQA